MAVDNLISAMGGLPDVYGAVQRGINDQIAQQGAIQQNSAQQQAQDIQQWQFGQAIQQAAQQQAQKQAYQAAVQSFIVNPTAEGASNLQLKFPEQAKQIAAAWDQRSTAAQDADRQQLARVYSALDNSSPDLALKELQARQAADKASGKNEPMVDTLIQAIQQNPDHAKGIAAYALASLPGGEDFARSLKAIGVSGDEKNHVITPGGALVDSNGKVLFQSDANPKYMTLKNADGTESIVALPNGPGAGRSASGDTSGRFTGGWTPRQRNGGDNTDQQVDNKISGMSKALGIDPTAPFPSNMSNMDIAKALTLSEGGKGSLADRNNNLTNLRDPKTLAYRSFATKDAGLAAAAAQVARNRKRGQNTIQSMVEGLPVGGSSGGNAGGAQIVATSKGGDQASGGPEVTGEEYLATLPFQRQQTIKAIAEGRATPPKPGTKFGQAILEQVAQYDPTFDAANAQSRQKTRVDFTSGKAATAVNALNTAMGHLIHLDDQAHDLGNFETAPGVLNPAYNWMREKVGGNTSIGAFNQTKQAAASEMRKVFSGSSGGNLTELEEWQSSLTDAKSYPQLHAAIANGVKLMGSRLDALKDQYTNGMGRSDQSQQFLKPSLARKAAQQLGVDLGGGQATNQPTQLPSKPNPLAGPPAGATRAARNPKTGQMLYLVNGKWVGG